MKSLQNANDGQSAFETFLGAEVMNKGVTPTDTGRGRIPSLTDFRGGREKSFS